MNELGGRRSLRNKPRRRESSAQASLGLESVLAHLEAAVDLNKVFDDLLSDPR